MGFGAVYDLTPFIAELKPQGRSAEYYPESFENVWSRPESPKIALERLRMTPT